MTTYIVTRLSRKGEMKVCERLGSKIGVSKMGVGKMALIHPTVQPYHWVRSSTVLHGWQQQ